jgi:uncharacterized protein YmfQ (DUF2313 family)
MQQFIRDSKPNLTQYIPEFLRTDETISNVLQAESDEHEKERLTLIDILNQFFIDSATWGLESWEKVFQLYPKKTDTYELRRARIYAKLQSKQVSTVKFLRDTAAKYFPVGSEVSIQEENEKNLFYLIANATALQNDYASLVETIDNYKPAHLAMIIQHFLDAVGGLGVGGTVQVADIITITQEGL